jgi:hypothetical protein
VIAVLLLIATLGEDSDSTYVDASVELAGELLNMAFIDVDQDGQEELCLALRMEAGGRELHLHRIEGTRIPPRPYQVIPVLEETLAYGFADVRSEAGLELFFLTKDGAWSYSLTQEGYRGNIRRLVETELVYDVPDPHSLPRWKYVFPAAGGDRILLPARDGFAVWAPETTDSSLLEATSYRAENDFTVHEAMSRQPRNRRQQAQQERTEVRVGPGGIQMTRDTKTLGGLLLPDSASDTSDLLEVEQAYGAPALLDVDGDGHDDLLVLEDLELSVYLADSAGAIPTSPTRIEALPDYLRTDDEDENDEDRSISIRFADLDGDGDQDILARDATDPDGFENGSFSLRILLNDGERLLPDKPQQVLRFEAAELRVHVTDVDGDGRPDLALRKFELPSLLDAVTGLEFTLTHLLFLGKEKGSRPFERKPALKQGQTFDETTLQEAIKNRELAMDCDGDGVADMVEVDLKGRIAIRRLKLEDGFFSGPSWSIEESPWLRFDTYGSVNSIQVRDLNNDGLGDIISAGSETATILLSRAAGK